jgi:hypothetical protein
MTALTPIRLYIAGPMTGLPDFNYPAFNAEARVWRCRGFHVENPAEGPDLSSWSEYMRRALRQLLTCEAICLLPGWTQSKGATTEWLVASLMGMSIIYHEPPGRLQLRLFRWLGRLMPATGAVITIRPHRLLQAAKKTLAENAHLADGDNSTLLDPKRVVEMMEGGEEC